MDEIGIFSSFLFEDWFFEGSEVNQIISSHGVFI